MSGHARPHHWVSLLIFIFTTSALAVTSAVTPSAGAPATGFQEYAVPAGSHPHDVAPARDGGVWYAAQPTGELGHLDPRTGATRHIKLGDGAAPHGVIVGPDGAPWLTDGGLNAIVRVDPATSEVKRFPLPASRPRVNLNTAVFDRRDIHWFTGQGGVYGRLDVSTGQMQVFDAPRGPGPYGIASTPDGTVYYASLAGNFVGRIDAATGATTVLEAPTARPGPRRVWSDSHGRIWVSAWNTGQLGMYDPAAGRWKEWRLPGEAPRAYAVYVDNHDIVWITDWGANALVRFDPARETFEAFRMPSARSDVRQILGRPGEVWLPESAVDKIAVFRTP